MSRTTGSIRELQQQTQRVYRQVTRAYRHARVTLRERAITTETDEEIREALRTRAYDLASPAFD